MTSHLEERKGGWVPGEGGWVSGSNIFLQQHSTAAPFSAHCTRQCSADTIAAENRAKASPESGLASSFKHRNPPCGSQQGPRRRPGNVQATNSSCSGRLLSPGGVVWSSAASTGGIRPYRHAQALRWAAPHATGVHHNRNPGPLRTVRTLSPRPLTLSLFCLQTSNQQQEQRRQNGYSGVAKTKGGPSQPPCLRSAATH